MRVLCSLGRVLPCNHSMMLHRDARSREALAANRGPCNPPQPKAACPVQQVAVPARTHIQKANTPHTAHSQRTSPELGGSETAKLLLNHVVSGQAVPCTRQGGVGAITAQRPGGKGLSTKWLPSIQLQGPVRANQPTPDSCLVQIFTPP